MISRSKLARLSERISTMATKFRLSSLIPAGLMVEGSDESNGGSLFQRGLSPIDVPARYATECQIVFIAATFG